MDETERRITLIVRIDLDAVPGAMHTRASAEDIVESILTQSLGHYNPKVIS